VVGGGRSMRSDWGVGGGSGGSAGSKDQGGPATVKLNRILSIEQFYFPANKMVDNF
jgi:hypothetical protein